MEKENKTIIDEIKNLCSNDESEYAIQVINIAYHFFNQLVDIATDSYGIGFTNYLRKEAVGMVELLVKIGSQNTKTFDENEGFPLFKHEVTINEIGFDSIVAFNKNGKKFCKQYHDVEESQVIELYETYLSEAVHNYHSALNDLLNKQCCKDTKDFS